jgi:hypothetical protein
MHRPDRANWPAGYCFTGDQHPARDSIGKSLKNMKKSFVGEKIANPEKCLC